MSGAFRLARGVRPGRAERPVAALQRGGADRFGSIGDKFEPDLAPAGQLDIDLRDTNAMLFKNARTGRHNMVYRRRDGSIGWVEPR